MDLTPKQQAFCQAKAAGMTHEKSAIAAGYSVNGASPAAHRLLALPKIKAEIARLKRGTAPKRGKGVSKVSDSVNDRTGEVLFSGPDEFTDEYGKPKMQRSKYADPKDFLIDMMNNPSAPFAIRQDCAKKLMDFMHGKPADKGKKESRSDKAKEVTGVDTPKAPGRDRLHPSSPPKLRSVA